VHVSSFLPILSFCGITKSVFLPSTSQTIMKKISFLTTKAFLIATICWNSNQNGVSAKKMSTTAEILFPGFAPVDYDEGSQMNLFVNLVESTKTQVPYEYYALPHCQQKVKEKNPRASLGSKLQGSAVKTGPFDVKFKENSECVLMCRQQLDTKQQLFIRKLIKRQYRVHLYLDGLPVMMKSEEYDYAVRGYPVGFVAPPEFTGLETEEYFLYNHVRVIISYSKAESGYHIVAFNVFPVSINHKLAGNAEWNEKDMGSNKLATCTASSPAVNNPKTFLMVPSDPKKDTDQTMDIIYSHDIVWQESNAKWADRWDIYTVGNPDDEIHYFAIVNSLMIVLFLTAAVGMIVLRTLKKDISAYNEMQALEEPQEEGGWKLVHGDVFRPPTRFKTLLAVAVGTGAQIGIAFLSTMVLAVVNILNPMMKGRFLTTVIVLYVLSGSVSGYCSSRLYKFFNGKKLETQYSIHRLCLSRFTGRLVSVS